MSIFNSTSRTVFPLTDDYELVTKQLTSASKALKGVESQDDIDKMSDAEYRTSPIGLEGTQNRKDATSLDWRRRGVSCAAMLPVSLMAKPIMRMPTVSVRHPSCWPPTTSCRASPPIR